MKNLLTLVFCAITLALISNTQAQNAFGWGSNSEGELGLNTSSASSKITEITALAAKEASLVSAGASFTIFHKKSPFATYAFGKNNNNQLGIDNSLAKLETPTPITALNNIELISLSSGYAHTVLIAKSGAVWSWGLNTYGQLGLGNTVTQKTPQRVTFFNSISNGTSYNKVTCGDNHCMIYSTVMQSAVYGWGRNHMGQLSNGNTTDMSTPVFVPSYMMQNVSQISCGGNHCLARSDDGSVLCSGANNMGQCGFNSTAQFTVARGIVGNTKYKWIKACATHSVGMSVTGMLWSFGSNSKGELGQGTTSAMVTLPTAISATSVANASAIDCGTSFTIVLKDNKAYGFGDNSKNQLSLANSMYNAPQMVRDFNNGTATITLTGASGMAHTVLSVKAGQAPTQAPTTQAPTTQAPTTAPPATGSSPAAKLYSSVAVVFIAVLSVIFA